MPASKPRLNSGSRSRPALHVYQRTRTFAEPDPAVQLGGIPGQQRDPAKTLKIRVGQHALGQPATQAAAPVAGQDYHVGPVGVRSQVRNGPSKSGQDRPVQQGKTDRVLNGAHQDLALHLAGPEGCSEQFQGGIGIDALPVGGDDQTIAPEFQGSVTQHGGTGSDGQLRPGGPIPGRCRATCAREGAAWPASWLRRGRRRSGSVPGPPLEKGPARSRPSPRAGRGRSERRLLRRRAAVAAAEAAGTPCPRRASIGPGPPASRPASRFDFHAPTEAHAAGGPPEEPAPPASEAASSWPATALGVTRLPRYADLAPVPLCLSDHGRFILRFNSHQGNSRLRLGGSSGDTL